MRNQEGMRLTYGLTGMGLRTGHAADSPVHKLRASYRHWGLPGTGWLLIALSQQCGPTAPDALASGAFTYNVARIFSLCSSRLSGRMLTCEHHSITAEDGKGSNSRMVASAPEGRIQWLIMLTHFFLQTMVLNTELLVKPLHSVRQSITTYCFHHWSGQFSNWSSHNRPTLPGK